MKKIFIHTCIGLVAAISLIGCGKREAPEEETTISPEAEYTISDMDSLEEGAYYVYRGGTYYQLYVGNANFTVSKS